MSHLLMDSPKSVPWWSNFVGLTPNLNQISTSKDFAHLLQTGYGQSICAFMNLSNPSCTSTPTHRKQLVIASTPIFSKMLQCTMLRSSLYCDSHLISCACSKSVVPPNCVWYCWSHKAGVSGWLYKAKLQIPQTLLEKKGIGFYTDLHTWCSRPPDVGWGWGLTLRPEHRPHICVLHNVPCIQKWKANDSYKPRRAQLRLQRFTAKGASACIRSHMIKKDVLNLVEKKSHVRWRGAGI